jgi:hypothetical protein
MRLPGARWEDTSAYLNTYFQPGGGGMRNEDLVEDFATDHADFETNKAGDDGYHKVRSAPSSCRVC